MSHTNLDNDNIDSAKIKFKVEKSWFETNGYSPGDAVLYRFTDKWDALDTVKTDEDATHYYFEAAAPGLSYFAIAGENASAAEQPQDGQVQEGSKTGEQQNASVQDNTAQEGNKTGAGALTTGEQELQKKGVSTWLLITLLILVAGIGLAAFFILKKN